MSRKYYHSERNGTPASCRRAKSGKRETVIGPLAFSDEVEQITLWRKAIDE
jgi:hypothetical protein